MARWAGMLLIFGIVFLVGCASSGSEVSPGQAEKDAAGLPWVERYFLLGQETYESYCSSCHDSGQNGAPAIGDRDAWSGRSPLWSAVLFEHAKRGFMEMPAKGGHSELSDLMVEAAGEYILNVTFPELPKG